MKTNQMAIAKISQLFKLPFLLFVIILNFTPCESQTSPKDSPIGGQSAPRNFTTDKGLYFKGNQISVRALTGGGVVTNRQKLVRGIISNHFIRMIVVPRFLSSPIRKLCGIGGNGSPTPPRTVQQNYAYLCLTSNFKRHGKSYFLNSGYFFGSIA